MDKSETNHAAPAKTRKVVITLRDRDAVGRVYAKINGRLTKKEIFVEALKQVEEGNLYVDKSCKQPLQDRFIEVYEERRLKKKDEDFVFLIDIEHAKNHVVAVKIV